MDTAFEEDIILPELFDALPESVVLFKPVTDANNVVTDFEIAYCNKVCCNFLQVPKHLVTGQTLFNTALINGEYKKDLFKKCLAVWQTGKQHEETLYNELLGRHFSTLRSKIKEGVISVTRDRTEHYNAEKARQEQLLQFTSVLDASADGVMILEAMRTQESEVFDFRLTHCNKAAFTLARLSPTSVGKTLLEILPHLNKSEQLELHKKVLATGIPERIETTFRNEREMNTDGL